MNGTESFPVGDWVDVTGKTFTSKQLEDHVTIISRSNCAQSEDISGMLNKFFEQFKDTKKANFIILDSCPSGIPLIDETKTGWYVFSCLDSTSFCRSISSSWPEGMTHALIDKNQVIRSYYTSGTKDEKRVLLEHMALLLPRERSEKVELKRGDNK